MANAWASAAKKPKTEQKEILSLPAPKDEVFVTDARGRIKSKNPEVTLPRGLQVNLANVENTQRDRGIGSYVGGANSVSQNNEPAKPLALPAPNNVMVTDAQGNTIQTTENNVPKKQRNADISVPSGLDVDVSNAANTQRDRGVGSYSGSASNLIVRQDGKPFHTEQVAQQALTNKTTKKTKAKKNEPVISKDTHTVVPFDGGFAIAPVEEVKSVVNQGVTEIKQEPTQAKPKTDAKQINTIGSKEDGLIASKFREDLKSFLTKIDEIDGYENEPSDLHKFSTILTNEILQKRAKNQDDLKGFISKSLDMALDESNYVGLEGAFNDRSRINAVEEFLYEKAKSTGSLSFENKEGDLVKKDEPIVTKVEQPIIDDPSGDYFHSQFPDATATVTKTDKGYDIDWGDEVESFTGKNAAIKTQAALKKENFNKKNPDDDNGGVAVEPVAPKPKPVSPSGGVIPRVHLDRISRGLKDGKTVEEIATKIQKSLPHLTIEDVTQQVLAEQEKASKPATLDSIIGKYSDDEEVDEEIRQSGEVLKKFLPETVDDWKIDNDTFATRGAWRVSYTKPFITINRITGKEVVSSTTKAAPLDIDILLSGDEQAIKNHIKERLRINGITPKGVKDWRLDDTVSPTGQQVVDNTPTKPVSPTNTTQTTPKTTPNTVVERVKNGEEIVYKQPAAIDSNKKSVFEALTRYGWSLDAVLGGVSKTFAGLAEAGAISDGSRNLNADFDSRERYLAVTDNDAPTGGAIIPETEIDLRDYGYNAEAFAKAAKAFNEKVEAYVLKRRELAQQSEQNDGNWVKQDEPVTAESSHIDNGKIEEVTGEVIRESLAKVDDKPINGRTMSLKEAKQWLLDSIDKAIAVAPKTLNKAGKDAIEKVNDLEGKIREKSITRSEEDKKGIQDARNLLKDLYITFDVPNDGKFKVLNTIESLQKFKDKVQKTKGFTENQKPVKPFSAPSENSPETTISNFLADGELENAYFFAENQDKPIKFGLNGKNEPLAYFLTEPIDLGNGIKGFVGISTYPMLKSKRWLVS